MQEKIRCHWCGDDPLYQKYHDEEWGKPVYDDHTLFEFLILEGFQAGLSWITILRRREGFRQAFDNFDYQKISEYQDQKIEDLKNDERIIRNRLKILAAINNAKKFMQIQQEFGSFSKYLWNFTNNKIIDNQPNTAKEIPVSTSLSDKISKDLKKRGFKFVGTTIIYAYLQAVGVVNDHINQCFAK